MNPTLTSEQALTVPETVVARAVGSEMVLLDLDEGTYFTLNGTGAFIWQQITSGVAVTEIAAGMVQGWEVELEDAAADIEAFLVEMVDLGLLVAE